METDEETLDNDRVQTIVIVVQRLPVCPRPGLMAALEFCLSCPNDDILSLFPL